MFTKLLELFNKNINKTPLEDFTTELMVGVLRNDEELKIKFAKSFLKLKSEYFKLSTQKKYFLENDPNCIIDIVVEGEKEICFIENKVNSKEGYIQLERYSKVLSKFKQDGFSTKLIYCTKNSEPKEIIDHDFKHVKWIEIADFFRVNSKSTIANLFVKYLNETKMSEDMTIYSKDLITMENFSRVHNLIYQNIENTKQEFSSKFGKANISDHRHTLKGQILQHNRVVMIKSPIIKSQGYSELLYGIDFSGQLTVHLYLSKDHQFYSDFKEMSKDADGFKIEENAYGIVMQTNLNMGSFLNDDNSQEKIKEWFSNEFAKFENFMDSTSSKINWSK